jgi:tight adherence protein B
MESQLGDAIDLMVASLRAGSALVAALEATLGEARSPIRQELESMVGRIRLGEDPRSAVRDLALRVPLESFRLFSHSLLVHWETGGSLASSLRTVGRTVRDRLEVSRRISAQAVESQVSVIAVMGISYGLTLFMLKSNPGPLLKLLYSEIGSYVASGLMILQAIGMTWIWRMSRIRF